MKNTCTIILTQEEETLNVQHLADYFSLFNAAVVALNSELPVSLVSERRTPSQSELDSFRAFLRSLSPFQWNSFIDEASSKTVIGIGAIKRDSPFEIIIAGSVLLNSAAVAFSGGKISLNRDGLKAEVQVL